MKKKRRAEDVKNQYLAHSMLLKKLEFLIGEKFPPSYPTFLNYDDPRNYYVLHDHAVLFFCYVSL
jgi:hypothetical protein